MRVAAEIQSIQALTIKWVKAYLVKIKEIEKHKEVLQCKQKIPTQTILASFTNVY